MLAKRLCHRLAPLCRGFAVTLERQDGGQIELKGRRPLYLDF